MTEFGDDRSGPERRRAAAADQPALLPGLVALRRHIASLLAGRSQAENLSVPSIAMPDVDANDARRGRLLPVLFWAGVGLAPLAALLLVLGSGSALRLGGVLGVLVVVMIGLSIALRPDVATVKLQIEETILEDIDMLRAEVREEIAAASRATHQMVGERLGAAVATVRAERPQLTYGYQAPQAVPPSVPQPSALPPGYPPSAPPGYAPRSAPPPAGRHSAPPSVSMPGAPPQTYSNGYGGNGYGTTNGYGGNGYGATNGYGGDGYGGNGRAAPTGARRGDERPGARGYPPPTAPPRSPARPATGRATPPPMPPSAPPTAAPTGGVYRHFDTDYSPNGGNGTNGSSYGANGSSNGDSSYGQPSYDGGYGSQDWSQYAPRSRAAARAAERMADRYSESWTEQKLREKYGRRPRPHEYGDQDNGQWRPVSAGPVSAGPVSAGPVSAGPVSAGPRHSAREPGGGTIEGRWRENEYSPVERVGEVGGGYSPSYGQPDYTRRALPAGSSGSSDEESSWNDGWDEPVRESRGRRHRQSDDRGYGRSQRRLDYEVSDERWR